MQASRYFINQLNRYSGYPSLIKERDGCGVGFITYMNQPSSHALIRNALHSLECMEHRGGCSADNMSGDGAGLTTEIPWHLLFDKPNLINKFYGMAMIFMPQSKIDAIQKIFKWVLEENNISLVNWREVPVNNKVLGNQAKKNEPYILQCIVKSDSLYGDELEKALFLVRKKIEQLVGQTNLNLNKQFYICSFSSRIVVYKGMVRSEVLKKYYKDLNNKRYKSKFAIYHRRFSTNTMPKWPLAQPMRSIAHNGEINTLTGNLNWMQSKELLFIESKYFKNFSALAPITNSENSDSANLDSVFELLIHAGKSPQESAMILIPESYKNQPALKQFPEIVNFYEYYNALQEPWDGPALVVFTDGKIVGATLDRNGLRPARYTITKDGIVSLSSETGISNILDHQIIKKGRLGPGQILCVDMINKLVLDNYTVKQAIANKLPYEKWVQKYQLILENADYLNETQEIVDFKQINQLHNAFGYTNEDVELVIEHMASSAKEPTFCMGDDTPLAVLSNKPHLLFDYFKQRFAQVTNPAIDPLRESLVMSLEMYLGPKGSILEPTDSMAKVLKLNSPILNEAELNNISNFGLKTATISTFVDITKFAQNLNSMITQICNTALINVRNNVSILILSDRFSRLSSNVIYIPPLLIVGALHHYLINKQLRHKVSLIVETGQCWSTHHFACLIGYGASAVCPYLAFATVRHWWSNKRTQKLMLNGKLPKLRLVEVQANYRSAIEKGLLKILSKMGISLLTSYHGAQIFEILGLGEEVVQLAFKGTTSSISGMNLTELSEDIIETYNIAFNTNLPKKLPNLGYVQYRPSAEYHVNNPEMSKTLHKAVRNQDRSLYFKYQKILRDRPITNLRDLLNIGSSKAPISIDKVEPVSSILKRFCTGGMSLGALSRETHETLAIAMNRIGGKSNSGEGGEDPLRFNIIKDIDRSGTSLSFSHLKGLQLNDTASSAIKQIASGRFGVTPEYLVNARQLEIKIAQGAKPGEGGQLPGKKVSPYIAELRNCKPGVTLISPPPHHDIYSIEDLAQLIFDLHQINPKAYVSVKLVSEIGIGTIAAGVAKANADIIQISGHDGGTGASPLSSIKHAGSPWELGLTEVHNTLVNNNLRHNVILRVDGGLRTGQDIILASIMGAEEFGFGTIAMITTGCVMARICHTNNCPVGVATQRQDLRNRFPGIPSDLVNFFIFIAEEIREILANLGYESLQDIIGLNTLLQYKKINILKKTTHLDLSVLFNQREFQYLEPHYFVHKNENVLDDLILQDLEIMKAINHHGTVSKNLLINNTHRCVGSRIAGCIVKKYGNFGFNGNLQLNFKGSAGQSFGAFISKGMHVRLIGEANDYVGKGMSGGEIIVCPLVNYSKDLTNNVIIGNTCLYGATGGYLFVNGQAGERFAVRNSSAQAIVEGVGDHACEYMTGGLVVVLGLAGRNIAAGMTGGLAYFLDEQNTIMSKLNSEIVSMQRIVTKEGEEQLKNILELYEIKTKSIKAQKILQNWDAFFPLFWQIFPPSESLSPITNLEYSSSETNNQGIFKTKY